jgi:TPR repeat protein
LAGSLRDAARAYRRFDYATALRLLRSLAERGGYKAQNNLGFMYANGNGVPQDDAEAMKWYGKAADQGLDAAQAALGFGYCDGRGAPGLC